MPHEAQRDAYVAKVARVCHEAVRTYRSTLGDDSTPSWQDAPAWLIEDRRDSTRFLLDHPSATLVDFVNHWYEKKRRDGWVYGPVKSGEAKTHPFLVPYRMLPMEQRLKNTLIMNIVDTFRRPYAALIETEVHGEDQRRKLHVAGVTQE